MKALRDNGLTTDFTFKIPLPFPSKSGHTFVKLSDGNCATLWELIEGTLPKLRLAKEIGAASGQLAMALGALNFSPEELKGCSTPPYNDLYAVHPTMNNEKGRELFMEITASEVCDHARDSVNALVDEIKELETNLDHYHGLNLPKCLVHGDLHYDNVLTTETEVTGLLDFEFCALDWRAMELAICLTKYCGEADPYPYLKDFIEGYSVHGKLTKTEIESIPELMKLRILSNVIYFVGRWKAKEDTINQLTDRAGSYKKRCIWINDNRQKLIDTILEAFSRHNHVI